MADGDFSSTLAYTRSPKTSRRTTFQDELKAVVNERAVRNRASWFNSKDYNDDDDDDDDDVLEELLKTRRKKIDMFKASRTKTSFNDFKLSDDDEENIRPKKVSFLKSQRNSDLLKSDSFRSDRSLISDQSMIEAQSRGRSHLDSEFTSESPAERNSRSESPGVKKSQSESSPCRRSLSESPLPLYSENSQWESGSECVLEAITPTPAPRQRAPHSALSGRDEQDGRTQTPSSRPATSPVSNTNTFTTMSSQATGNSGSDVRQDNTLSRSLEGAESADLSAAEEKKTERHQLRSEVCPAADGEMSITWRGRSSGSRPGSSRKSRSSTEARYLGTLKVLEQKLCLQETGPDTADSLRAAIYQDWLKKKEEKLQETFRAKKQEEKLKEDKKTEEEASKRAEAKASYEAWKQKKREALKEKIREKQEAIRKVQKEMDDKEEKKETAKQVFVKWKREHDDLLHEQQQKQVQTEKRLKEKKEKDKEQRRRESSSSFAQWSDRKKEVIEEKLKSERRKKEMIEIEEKYEKEEREKTALDMYEQWLRKKEFQQKQERSERKVKAIVVEAPPPWSPPNRTIPFGK